MERADHDSPPRPVPRGGLRATFAALVTCVSLLATTLIARAVPLAPAKSPQAVWLVGDSIVTGAPGGKPRQALRDRLAARLPSKTVLQYSRGFWTMGLDWYVPTQAGGPARPAPSAILPLLLPGDAVLLMLGSNDYGLGVPMEDFRKRYAEMVDGLSTADLVLLGPGPTVRVVSLRSGARTRPSRISPGRLSPTTRSRSAKFAPASASR